MLETSEVDEILAEVGIVTLRAALRDRTVEEVYPPEEVERFAKIAAHFSSGTIHRGERDVLHEHFAGLLLQVLNGDCFKSDGVECVRAPLTGEPVEVTEARVRHWSWMNDLCTDDDVVAELLRQVPTGAREEATAFAKAFESAVADLEAD